MVRKKTVARFEEWITDPANIDEFFRLIVEERKRFRDACVALNVPYTLMYPLVDKTPELKERYDAALKAVAHELDEEIVEIADETKWATEMVTVASAKARMEAREIRSRRLDRERYGDPKEVGRLQPITIQIANLRGDTSVHLSSDQAQALPEVLTVPREES